MPQNCSVPSPHSLSPEEQVLQITGAVKLAFPSLLDLTGLSIAHLSRMTDLSRVTLTKYCYNTDTPISCRSCIALLAAFDFIVRGDRIKRDQLALAIHDELPHQDETDLFGSRFVEKSPHYDYTARLADECFRCFPSARKRHRFHPASFALQHQLILDPYLFTIEGIEDVVSSVFQAAQAHSQKILVPRCLIRSLYESYDEEQAAWERYRETGSLPIAYGWYSSRERDTEDAIQSMEARLREGWLVPIDGPCDEKGWNGFSAFLRQLPRSPMPVFLSCNPDLSDQVIRVCARQPEKPPVAVLAYDFNALGEKEKTTSLDTTLFQRCFKEWTPGLLQADTQDPRAALLRAAALSRRPQDLGDTEEEALEALMAERYDHTMEGEAPDDEC